MADVIVNASPLQYLHQVGQLDLYLNLPLLGTAGILLRAKYAGHLQMVGPVLNQLAALGFRLTPETVRNILDLAGE